MKIIESPQQKSNVILKLNHLEHRDNPDELLLSLYQYTVGFKKFSELVSQQFDPECQLDFKLDRVEHGSITFKSILGLRGSLINFITEQIHDLVLDNPTKPEDIEAKAEELESVIAKEMQAQLPANTYRVEPYIDRVTLAEVCTALSDGGIQPVFIGFTMMLMLPSMATFAVLTTGKNVYVGVLQIVLFIFASIWLYAVFKVEDRINKER